jgi:nicotinate-nucleotide pyrophosphorylase (carboxylating)
MQKSDYLPLIELALREDLGELGDITSEAAVPAETAAAILWSKDDGVLAGQEVFAAVFREVDASVDVSFNARDGERLRTGEKVARIHGPIKSLLTAERTALNFLSFLSGIATATSRLVSRAAVTGHASILDTRKTLPGYRALSKYAVAMGGGRNHRMGLYDMILIKDNHIDSAGSISAAVRRARQAWGTRFSVEVECRTQAEVSEALSCGVDMVMLDNMSLEEMRQATALVGGRAKVEASGNMTEEKVAEVSATGVDFISVGMLTHSARAFDFSLKIGREEV